MTDEQMPDGYAYEPSSSAFINHIGKVHHRQWKNETGEHVFSSAIRIRQHHVNTWGFAHGSFMAGMAEIGCTAGAYEPGGPPVVAVEMSMHFIAAPRLGELLEVHGQIVRRTRTLAFTQCRAESDGKLVFTATSVQKIVGA